MTDNEISHGIIGATIEVHRLVGPGLLESAYEEILAKELTLRKLAVERQKTTPRCLQGREAGVRYIEWLLVENRVVVELKFIESFAAILEVIILTYLRLQVAD